MDKSFFSKLLKKLSAPRTVDPVLNDVNYKLPETEDVVKIPCVKTCGNDLPNYSHKYDAAFDMRANIKSIDKEKLEYFHDAELVNDENEMPMVRLKPFGRAMIPLGFKAAIPSGYEVEVDSRSGLSIAHGVTVINAPGTIDSNFRNEWCVLVINLDPKKEFYIHQCDRLCQGKVRKVIPAKFVEVDSLNVTERDGGFGSSGVK